MYWTKTKAGPGVMFTAITTELYKLLPEAVVSRKLQGQFDGPRFPLPGVLAFLQYSTLLNYWKAFRNFHRKKKKRKTNRRPIRVAELQQKLQRTVQRIHI